MSKIRKVKLMVITPILIFIGSIFFWFFGKMFFEQIGHSAFSHTQMGVIEEYNLLTYDARGILAATIKWVSLVLMGVSTIYFIFVIPYAYKFFKKSPEQILEGNKEGGLDENQNVFINNISWGAFFCPTAWAFTNRLYVWSIASFVPLFNIYIWLKLFTDGRHMSWKQGEWKSFEQFKIRQRITVVINILIYIVLFLLLVCFTIYGIGQMAV